MATSVDVEHIFSCAVVNFFCPNVHSHLSAQSTWAHLCMGSWSRMGLIKDKNVMAYVKGDEEEESKDGWNEILKQVPW